MDDRIVFSWRFWPVPNRVFLASGLSVLLVAMFVTGCSSPGFESSRGNGQISAPTGTQAFEVQFDGFWLTQPGTHVYEFQELPTLNLCAVLGVQELTPETLDRIARAGTFVKMTLVGITSSYEPRRLITREGRLDGEWGTTPESWSNQPIEYVGMWFTPNRHERFRLTIEVTVPNAPPVDTASAALNVWAMPIIRGGHELSPTDQAEASKPPASSTRATTSAGTPPPSIELPASQTRPGAPKVSPGTPAR